MEESTLSFEDRGRAGETLARKSRRQNAALGGATGMKPLDPGAVGPPLGQARSLSAGDTERTHEGITIKIHRHRCCRRCTEHTAQRRRMDAVMELTSTKALAQPAHHFVADIQCAQESQPGTA